MPRPNLRPVPGKKEKTPSNTATTSDTTTTSDVASEYDRFGLTLLATMLGTLVFGNLLVYLGAFNRIPQLAIWLTVSKEASFATWIQVQLWACVGLAACFEALSLRRGLENRRDFYRWAFIAAFFFWLSMDDFLSVHETFGQAMRRFFASGALGDFGYAFANFRSNLWLVLLGPVYALGFYVTLDGLRRELPRSTFMKLVPAALACFAIAVGIDFVEGILRRNAGPDFWAMPGANWLYLAVTIEELLEIAGTGLILQATIDATIPGFRRRILGR